MKYAGKDQRIGDLFQNKGLLKSAQTFLKRAFKVKLLIPQKTLFKGNRKYLFTALAIFRKLPEEEYPTLNKSMMYNNPREQQNIIYLNILPRPNLIIIFQLGGTTFEEAKEVAGINLKNSTLRKNQVILGGTTVHNSKTFLAEISQQKYGLDTSRVNLGPQVISFDQKL